MLRLLLRVSPAEDPAALGAELRRAQGSHVPVVLLLSCLASAP
jgi:hypothetical protein